MDLGLLLMEFGTGLGKDISRKEEKLKRIRQVDMKPCNCTQCLFCKEGITDGIFHSKRISHTKKRKKCSGSRENLGRSSYWCMCWRTRAATHPNESS